MTKKSHDYRSVYKISLFRMYARYLKRALDLLLALSFLIIFCVPMLILAILVYALLGQPILFRQMRPGMKGQPFTIYKFRSMRNIRDLREETITDHERLNTFGRMLRSSSLDELPELFNVIKGDMSLVGPRPLLVEYLDLYSPEQMRRHEVKPGITGWAQVNGRNAITWEEKFKLDVWYVDNYSLWLDFKILGLTMARVLNRSDINQSEETTMEEFDG